MLDYFIMNFGFVFQNKTKQTIQILFIFQTIPTNHLEKLRICGAGTKNRYGTIIASKSTTK